MRKEFRNILWPGLLLGGVLLALLAGWHQARSASTAAASAEIIEQGRQVYTAQCASCHGADLEGQPDWKSPLPSGRLPAPPHDESGHTWHHADELLFRIVKEGTTVALLSLGGRLQECLGAAAELDAAGLSTTVADARFAKPLDRELIRRLAREHAVLVTVEEGSVGGFGSHVLAALAEEGLLDGSLKVRSLVLPDAFQQHDKPEAMYASAGLDAAGIAASARRALGLDSGTVQRLAAPARG